MDFKDIMVLVGTIVGVAGFVYGYIKDKNNKKLNAQILDINYRIKANEMYEKIRNKREIFEEYMGDLVCLEDDVSIGTRKSAFIKATQKYTALYNEIEDFCTKLFDGAIKSEDYIIKTVVPVLSELAKKQVEFYKNLNGYAIKYSFDKLTKPDFKAFEMYDKFLIKYNNGDGSFFWRNIKDMRRDADFE